MQIYALDRENSLVSAASAQKQQDYICLECSSLVRIRKGVHRQAHFYHLQPNHRCTLHAKGMVHISLQQHLKALIPELELEWRFPAIQRIADAAWHAHKIVFEIQYSPITAQELQSRIASYHSIGYALVWIFHDQRYNQKKLTSAEDAAHSVPHYFSNMDARGNGIIYDQFALIEAGMRRCCSTALPIDLKQLHRHAAAPKFIHPAVLQMRQNWPLHFGGDLIDRLQNPSSADTALWTILDGLPALPDQSERLLAHSIKKQFFKFCTACRALFKLCLEKTCR